MSDDVNSDSLVSVIVLLSFLNFAFLQFEVFNKFKVIAHHDKLDYALLKVELNEGQTVPFLELNIEKNSMKTLFFQKFRLLPMFLRSLIFPMI